MKMRDNEYVNFKDTNASFSRPVKLISMFRLLPLSFSKSSGITFNSIPLSFSTLKLPLVRSESFFGIKYIIQFSNHNKQFHE